MPLCIFNAAFARHHMSMKRGGKRAGIRLSFFFVTFL
jgi:hypothetical protein